ncbi:MAG: DUF2953 domain-containing protein [Pseudomonadota bacterium]|jgi:hypothetical protein
MLLWVAVALTCLLAILAIPFDASFSVNSRERYRGRVAVTWLFGLVRLPLQPRRSPRQTAIEIRKPLDKSRTGRARHFIQALKSKGFLRRLLKLAIDLIKRIHVRRIVLHARIGLDDPADTGRLWAVVGPVAGVLAIRRGADIAIEPDFAAAVFEVNAEGEVRVVPIALIFVTLAFLLSPATLRAARTVLAGHR